uniref:Chlororespiratory reduction 41 n=1 Tax=Geranium phaeum TaxID=379952 RepID=A0A0F7J2D7_9ROSI|nr:chlororespiratory reduction 41 [Geranium phaeum]
MASTCVASLCQTQPKPLPRLSSQHCLLLFSLRKQHSKSNMKCTSAAAPQEQPVPDDFPVPSNLTTSPDNFPIEKRTSEEIIRQRKLRKELAEAEPPNYEIGWKRTKEIPLEMPKGYIIADFLSKLENLMGLEFGSTELLAKTGEIVAERAREEAEVIREDVDDRLITELFRVLRLLEMDLAMVKAAVKDETLTERLEQAKARCRQAILVANSF